MDLSGEYIAVTAPRMNPPSGIAIGRCYMFHLENNDWIEQQKIQHNDEIRFGYSVATDGDHVVIGAVGYTGYVPDQGGSAYVYRRDGEIWNLTSSLNAFYIRTNWIDDTNNLVANYFGTSVALKNNIIIIGAPGAQGSWPGIDQSKSHVFQFSGGEWIKIKELETQADNAGKGFGRSVSFDGKTIVIGSKSFEKIHFY